MCVLREVEVACEVQPFRISTSFHVIQAHGNPGPLATLNQAQHPQPRAAPTSIEGVDSNSEGRPSWRSRGNNEAEFALCEA